jgi:hypothetical protein
MHKNGKLQVTQNRSDKPHELRHQNTMTIRILAPTSGGAMYILSTTANAASSIPDEAAPWITAVLVAGVALLLVAVALWRRRAQAVSEAVDQARQRALHRHTERLATQIADGDF